MLKYNIDEIKYIPSKKIMIKGWIIGADILKIRIDKAEQEFGKTVRRADVLEKYKELADNDLLGFDIELEIEKEIDGIELYTYNENNELVSILSCGCKDIGKYTCSESILYSIDSVEVKENNVIIRGWAFSKYYEQVEIKVDGACNYEINKYERLDVIRAHNEYSTTGKCGFEIICRNHNISKKINLLLSDMCSSNSVVIGKTMMARKDGNLLKYIYRNLTFSNIKKGISYINNHGYKALIGKIKNSNLNKEVLYSQWLVKNTPTMEELEIQKTHKFTYEPLISIVVPTYNTSEHFLREMINSVVSQTYSNWELCIADGSSDEMTIRLLKEYSRNNDKIKVKYLEKNEGISGNTNKALELVKGEYIGLFDHDDLLTPDALYEVVKAINENDNPDFIYTDEDKVDENGTEFFEPHFKPDWSPDTLRSYNYITHFSIFKKSLMDKVGKFRSEFDGSQDHDLILRLTESAVNIVHIPKILYHWRVHKNSVASGSSAKPYAYEAAKKAISSHLNRCNIKGTVEDGLFIGSYKINYDIIGSPKVSIIIPNKEHKEDLNKCISSILDKTTYKNYEIIVAENNSQSKDIFDYYEQISKIENISVVHWKDEFNYSAINNFAISQSNGEYILLLNNDIEIISENWIEEMLMLAQRQDVGIVGAKLYYPDDTIQHAGVILGIGGVGSHAHRTLYRDDPGYFGRAKIVQNLSAVTAACLMIRREVYTEIEGLDEKYKVAFNDVDLCMKAREKGYLVIYTPYAEMYHYESKSRGSEDTEEKRKRFHREIDLFKKKWGLFIEDPYYNKNLTLDREDFSIRI